MSSNLRNLTATEAITFLMKHGPRTSPSCYLYQVFPITSSTWNITMVHDSPKLSCGDVDLVWVRYCHPQSWKAYCPDCGKLFICWPPIRVPLSVPVPSSFGSGLPRRHNSRIMAIMRANLESRAANIIPEVHRQVAMNKFPNPSFKPMKGRKPKVYSERHIGGILDLMNKVEAETCEPEELNMLLGNYMPRLIDHCETTKLHVCGILGDRLILDDLSRFELLHGEWVHVIPANSRRERGAGISDESIGWLIP